MLDLLIKNANIVDGSGRPLFRGDVGVKDGTIAAIGKLTDAEAAKTLDAAGRVLSPGFIDIHRHADAALFAPSFGECELLQGLTTVINGNCGLSLAPIFGPHSEEIAQYLSPITGEISPQLCFESIAAYLSAAEKQNPRLNAAMLIGMGTLRTCAAGMCGGDLESGQEKKLHALLERALSDGALGVSLGLGYAPEIFYSTEGLIRVLAPLRGSGRVISVHMRQEGDGVVEALREMLTVARALKTPIEISHLKAIGTRNHRKAVPEMLRMILRAREEGLDVTCDVYPYTAGSTQLLHVLPPEYQKGGLDALMRSLRSAQERKAMRDRMQAGRDFENITDLVGFGNVFAAGLNCENDLPFEGKSIQFIAEKLQKDPYDALFDLLADEYCTPSMIDFITDEDDIRDILRSPFSSVISDATYPSSGQKHPRVYGTFARLIEQYVVKEKTLTIETAIHKVTAHPANRYGLAHKGRIAVGADADLLLFSPKNVRERGSYRDSEHCASGFDMVFVGGELAAENGTLTDRRNGRILK